ncbi:MAG: ClbS/DfsB family four-helix bundle protein [Dehalococcoidales bacterium]|nr:MAG: ClbS/DfsB family four-helix bundle protein [Dehalococcoidales bacterium]
MTVEEQISNLTSNINEFKACISYLPDGLFLKKLDDWAPRDILAHLIGWNRSTVEGCQQIIKGETPSFFIDPGYDFSRFNAILVKEYNSEDRHKLIEELEISRHKLEQFLLSIDSDKWDNDYGVTYRGGSVTVGNMVEGLNNDYVNHRKQIETWVESGHISPAEAGQ